MATATTTARKKRAANPAPTEHASARGKTQVTKGSAWDSSRIQLHHHQAWWHEVPSVAERLSRLLVKEAKASIYELHRSFAEIYFQGDGWPADAAVWEGMEQERNEALAMDEAAPANADAMDSDGSGVRYGITYMVLRGNHDRKASPIPIRDTGGPDILATRWFNEYTSKVHEELRAEQYDEALKSAVLVAVEALKEWRPGQGAGKELWDKLENDPSGKQANEMALNVCVSVRHFLEGLSKELFGIERDFAFLRDAAYYGLNVALLRENPNDPMQFSWVPIQNAYRQLNANGTHPNAIWRKAEGREHPSTLSREEQLDAFVKVFLATVASMRKQWELKDSALVEDCLAKLAEQLKEWKPIVTVQNSTDLDAVSAAKLKLHEGVEALSPKLHAPAVGRLKWKGNMGELAALIRALENGDWVAKAGTAAARGRIVANLFEGEDGKPFDASSFEKWMQPKETPPSRVDFSNVPTRPREPAKRKREAKT